MPSPTGHFLMRMNNTSGSETFYEHVFNWGINTVGSPPGYWRIMDAQNDRIGEYRQAPPRTAAVIVTFFAVENLQLTLNRALQEQGEVEDIGFSTPVFPFNYAVLRDIEGCLFGIYQVS